MSRTLLLSLLSLIWVAACHPVGRQSEDAALRLQCNHAAAVWFNDTHPLGMTRETVLDGSIYIEQSTYEIHFASGAKHCYLLVSEEASVTSAEKSATESSRSLLYDLDAHLELGAVQSRWPAPGDSVDECVLNGRRCTSRAQWRQWTRAVWTR